MKPTMRRPRRAGVRALLPADLRALTIRQPWAWAIVAGHKCVENRTQPPPRALVGQLIAIHAGAAAFDVEYLERFTDARPREPLPRGAIVGFARLVGWTKDPRLLNRAQKRWYNRGSHGWLLDDVFLLKRPVAASGQLGFWRVSRSTRTTLTRRLKEPR